MSDFWPTKAAKSKREPTNAEMFRKLDADLYLANQLFRAGRSARVLEGVQSAAQTRERIRAEILAAGLAERQLRVNRGARAESFAQAFERLYGEPLA